MKAEFINPFIKAAANVMENMLCEAPHMGKPILRSEGSSFGDADMAVVIGVGGKAAGNVVFSMNSATAKSIAARLMSADDSLVKMDDTLSALSEMFNIVTANATIDLADAGYSCDITPPTIVLGPRFAVLKSNITPSVALPAILSLGEIYLDITVDEAKKTWREQVSA